MITVDSSASDHVEMQVAAPLTVADLEAAGSSLRGLVGKPALRRVMVSVESIGHPAPKAVWEDLKLSPLVRQMRWVALLTGIRWYARLSEVTGTLRPGLTIKHFEPDDVAGARAWLAQQPEK